MEIGTALVLIFCTPFGWIGLLVLCMGLACILAALRGNWPR